MAKATFLHGDPLMIAHTAAGTAIDAGDIIMIGDRPHIAHDDIAVGEKGALAAFGGVYRVEKDGTAGPEFSVGEDVAWDSSGELAVEVADGYGLGYALFAAGTNQAWVDVVHMPNGLSDGT